MEGAEPDVYVDKQSATRVSPALGAGWVAPLAGTALTNVASLGLGVVSGILAARLLGPEGRGELAAIQNWGFLLATVGFLGIPTAVAYHAGRHPEGSGRVFTTGALFLAGLSVPLMALGYVVMPYLLASQSESTVAAARVFLVFVFIQAVGGLPFWVLQGRRSFRAWNAMRVQFPVLWALLLIAFFFLSVRSSQAMAWGYLGLTAFHGLTWIGALVLLVRGPYRPDFSRLPQLVKYGLPSLMGNLPQQMNFRLGQLILAALMPAQTLGLYVVAYAWGTLVVPLLGSVGQVVFPLLAGMRDPQAQRRRVQATCRLSLAAAALMAGGLLLVTPLAFPFVYGRDFAQAVPAALILVVAGGLFGVNRVIGDTLRGIGAPQSPMIGEIVGLVLMLVLFLLLVREYGLMGVAVATLLGYLGTAVTLLALTARHTRGGLWPLLVVQREDVALATALADRALSWVGSARKGRS